MQVGDLVRIKRAFRSLYPSYAHLIGLVTDVDVLWGRPKGSRRIRFMHGEVDGEVYSVFAEEVLVVICV